MSLVEEPVGDKPKPVCFGDSIALYCDEMNSKGYLSAWDAVKGSVVVKKCDKKDPQLENFKMAVFKLVVPFKYKATRRLTALRQRLAKKKATNYLENDKDHQNLVRQAEADARENANEQRRQSGKAIKYGEIVQLQHDYTNKFLSIRTNEPATNVQNIRVDLRDNSDKSSFFMILPRFKLRSEGDEIMPNDTILLQSVKRPGHHLASDTQLPDPYLYEASLAVPGSPFVVVSHRRYQPEPVGVEKKAIHFGDTVCLHHRELDAHIQAEDVFFEDEVDPAPPYLRIRLNNQEEKESILSYFQIESHDEPTSGELVSWGKLIRLKHVASRKYLVLDDKGISKLGTLKKEPLALPAALTSTIDRNVAFKMQSFNRSTGYVTTEVYGRIEHLMTSSSLHGDKSSKGPAGRRNTDKRSLSPNSQVDYLNIYDKQDEKYDLTSSPIVNYDDAFTVELVSQEQLLICNTVMGLIPVLLEFIYRRKQAESWEVKAAESKAVMDTLMRFKDFLSQAEKKRINQRIFRHLGLVNICLQMLQAPFKPVPEFYEDDFNPAYGIDIKRLGRYPALMGVLRLVYDVFGEYITGGSRKNLLTVAYNIPFFQWQAPHRIHAEVMLMGLVKDEDEILNRIELPFIQNFIDNLANEQTSSYLGFLSACAVSRKRGLAHIQKYILDKLIVERQTKPVIAKWVVKEEEGLYFIHPSEPKSPKKFGDMSPEHQEYVINSVKLISNLCQGGNKPVIEELKKLKFVDFAICFNMVSKDIAAAMRAESNAVPSGSIKNASRLRKQFVSLLSSAFVDVDSPRILEETLLVSTYNDDAKKRFENREGLNGSTLDAGDFATLLTWISDFLPTVQPDTSGTDIGVAHNEVLTTILEMVHVLVEAGYYIKDPGAKGATLMEQLKKIVKHQLILTAKKTVNPSANDTTEEKLFTLDNQTKSDMVVAKPKNETDNFFEALDVDAEEKKIDYVALSKKNKSALAVTRTALKIIDSLIDIESRRRLFSFLATFVNASRGIQPDQKVSRKTVRLANHNRSITDLIVSLNENTGNEERPLDARLRKDLVGFLNDEVDAAAEDEADFIGDLFKCSRFDDWRMTHLCFSIIQKLHSPTHRLLDTIDDTYISVSTATSEFYRTLRTEHLPVLRSLSRAANLTTPELAKVAAIFAELKLRCHLKNDADTRHVVNQDLLYTVGLLDIVIAFMSRPINADMVTNEKAWNTLYTNLFKFLQSFIRGHALLQKQVFDRLDWFLDFPLCRPDMIRSLTSLFRDNQRLCMAIKESQIAKLVRMLADYNTKIPNMLELLNFIVKIDSIDLPLKRNQNFVLSNMLQRRSDTLLLVENNDNERRINLLVECSQKYWVTSKNGGAKEPDEHEYHWRLVRFLSSCAEGGNRYSESILQNIFDLPELYDVILHPQIHVDLKRPYLRYFLWVYLNSNSRDSDSAIAEIQFNPQFWLVLDMIADTLNTIAAKDFSKPLERHDSFFAFEAGATVPRKFFSQYFHMSEQLKEKVPNFKAHIDHISKAFLNFLTKMMEHTDRFTYHHKTLFSTALSAMYDAVTSKVDDHMYISDFHIIDNYAAVTEFQAAISDGGKTAAVVVKNEVVKDYEKNHQQDLAVNASLQKAVKSLRTTYEEETSTPDMKAAGITGGEEFHTFINAVLQDETLRVQPYRRYKLNVQRVRDIVHKMNESFKYSGKEDKADKQRYVETDEALLKLLTALIRMPRFPHAKDPRALEEKTTLLIQDHMCTAGVASVAVNFVSARRARGDDVSNASLLLLRDLLNGGNEKSQLALLQFFRSTSEESFFEDMRHRLTQRMIVFKELRSMKSQLIEDEKRTRMQTASQGRSTYVGGASHRKGSIHFSDRLKSFIQFEINDDRSSMAGSTVRNRNSIMIGDDKRKGTIGTISAMFDKRASVSTELGIDQSSSAIPLMPITPPPYAGGKKKKGEAPVQAPRPSSSNIKMKHIEESVKLADEESVSIQLLLQIMQNMAQGHNKELQGFLRAQEDNVGRSVDLVKEVATYLQSLYSSISLPTLPLVTQLVATLRSLCSGHSDNQQIAFDAKIMEVFNTVFRQKEPYPHCTFTELLELKVQSAGLLFTMVEHNDAKTKTILAPQVHAVVDKQLLEANMIFYAEHPQTLALLHRKDLIAAHPKVIEEFQKNREQYEACKVTTLDAGALFYSVLARFTDLGLEAPIVETDRTADLSRGALAYDTSRKARKALKERKKAHRTQTALELFKGSMNSIEVIHGNELEKVYFPVRDGNALRGWMKEDIQNNVTRTSSPTDKIQDFLRRCESMRVKMVNESRFRQNVLLDFIARYTKVWNMGIVFVTFIMQMFMLVTWQGDPMSVDETTPIEPFWMPSVLYALGAVHVICAAFIFVDHFVKNVLSDPTSMRKRSGILLNMYYLMIIGFSIGGFFRPQCYAFHLLHLVMNTKILKHVTRSITYNGRSLLLVGLLGLIVIYCFSMISFTWLRVSFEINDGMYCETLWQCFMTNILAGLLHGGGVGERLGTPVDGWTSYVWGRFFYDLGYFLMINVIGLNIVFALIVDTFSQLRDEQNDILQDMREKCFVCSLRSYDFDSHGKGGFQHHCRREHRMWNYLFFTLHLADKSQTMYTSIEHHVSTLRKHDLFGTDWIPISRSITLTEGKEERDEELEGIRRDVKRVLDRFEREDKLRQEEDEAKKQERYKRDEDVGGGVRIYSEADRAREVERLAEIARNLGMDPEPFKMNNLISDDIVNGDPQQLSEMYNVRVNLIVKLQNVLRRS